MQFQKGDMAGQHYSWQGDTAKGLFSGGPTRRLFDRNNGDQVLFLINFYGSQLEKFTLEDARFIEDKIYRQLPLEAKSEISVLSWLRNNTMHTSA